MVIRVTAIDRPACIRQFSQYPHEIEFLFLPCSFVQPDGYPYLQLTDNGVVTVYSAKLNVNLKARTTDEILGQKREMHLTSFRYFIDEITRDLEKLEEKADARLKNEFTNLRRKGGDSTHTIKQYFESIVRDCYKVYEEHERLDPSHYMNDVSFRGAVIAMLEVKTHALSKVNLYLEDESLLLEYDEDVPLREAHRRYISFLERTLHKVNSDFELQEKVVRLCRIKGLLEKDVQETNDLGEGIIMKAASEGLNSHDITLLTLAGADINVMDRGGKTALHRASFFGHVDAIEAFLELNIDPNSRDLGGETPIMTAAEQGHCEAIKILGQHRADVSLCSHGGFTSVSNAALYGHANTIETLAEMNANINISYTSTTNPLFYASKFGYVDAVLALLKLKADVNFVSCSEPDDDDPSWEADPSWEGDALFHAAALGRTSALRALLNSKADPTRQVVNNSSPILVAAENGHSESISILIECKGDLEATDGIGNTPMHIAAMNGHVDVLATLVDHGANLTRPNYEGATPVWVAAENGKYDAIICLVKHGANVKTSNYEGCTPVMIAGINGHGQALSTLCGFGADVHELWKSQSIMACSMTDEESRVDCLVQLVRYNGSINLRNSDGQTALWIAANYNKLESIVELVKFGADLNLPANDFSTPVYMAAANGFLDAVKYLVKNNANLDVQTDMGSSLMFAVAENGHSEIISYLLENQVSCQVGDNDGRSPLYMTAMNGNIDAITLLVSRMNADFGSGQLNRFSPLMAAMEYGHSEALEVLVKSGALTDAEDASRLLRIGMNKLATSPTNCNQNYLDAILSLFKMIKAEHARTIFDERKMAKMIDEHRRTPLWFAARHGNVHGIEMLAKICQQSHESVDLPLYDGSTPIFAAAENGHAEAVEALLNFHASANQKSIAGFTPLVVASRAGHASVVETLIRRMAEDWKRKHGDISQNNYLLDDVSDLGAEMAALNHATRRCDVQSSTAIAKNMTSLKDSNAVELLFGAAFHITVQSFEEMKNKIPSLDFLLKDHKSGKTVLHISAQAGNTENVKFLARIFVQSSPDRAIISLADHLGRTPLHYAAISNNAKIVDILVEEQADVSKCDLLGVSPIRAALCSGSIQAVVGLLKHGDQMQQLEEVDDEGQTPLLVATMRGETRLVEELVRMHANVNHQDHSGRSPLHIAAGNSKVLEALLKTNAKVEKSSKIDFQVTTLDGASPLWTASAQGQTDSVDVLVKFKASNIRQNLLGQTPLHAAMQNEQYVDAVLALLHIEKEDPSCFKDSLECIEGPFDSLLLCAARQGKGRTVELLIQRKAKKACIDEQDVKAYIDRQDVNGCTALYIAAEGKNHAAVFNILVEHKADINIPNFKGESPLYRSAVIGNLSTVLALLRLNALVDQPSKYGLTAVEGSLLSGNPDLDVIVALIQNRADVRAKRERDGMTPFLMAAKAGNVRAINTIMSSFIRDGNVPCDDTSAGSPLTACTNDGASAVFLAAEGNFSFAVESLAQYGVSVNQPAKQGQTPLHAAAELGYSAVIHVLLKHGADLKTLNFGLRTPLQVVLNVPQFLMGLGHIDSIHTLVQTQSDANVTNEEGFTPLHLAARVGSAYGVRALLAKNADIDAAGGIRGESALCLAALGGHEKVIHELILNKADVSRPDRYGVTAICHAAQNCSVKVILLLCKAAADINVHPHGGEAPILIAARLRRDKVVEALIKLKADLGVRSLANESLICSTLTAGIPSLEMVETLLAVIGAGGDANDCKRDGKTSVALCVESSVHCPIQYLVAQNANISLRDYHGRSPIWIAAHLGNLSTIEELARQSADVNVPCNDGITPLWAAARNGHAAAVEILIHFTADVSLNNRCLDSLFHAVKMRHYAVVDILATNRVDINLRDVDQSTPLYIASRANDVHTMDILLKHKADVNMNGADGQSPLFAALERLASQYRSSCDEIVPVLNSICALIELKSDPNAAAVSGWTPLLFAAKCGSSSLVKKMYEHGASIENQAVDGNTALHVAAEFGHDEIVKILLDLFAAGKTECNMGEDVDTIEACKTSVVELQVRSLVNMKNKEGSSPVLTAASHGHWKCIDELVRHKANVDTPNRSGRTPMFFAAQNGHLKTINVLVGHGAHVKTPDGDSVSPLQACMNQCAHLPDFHFIMAALVSHGALMLARDTNGNTPLHIAASTGKCDAISALLSRRADINCLSESGRTPLFLAVENLETCALHLLIDRKADANICNKDGISPLWSACQSGDVKAVAALVRCGADTNFQNKNGSNLVFAALGDLSCSTPTAAGCSTAIVVLGNEMGLRQSKANRITGSRDDQLAGSELSNDSLKDNEGIYTMVNHPNADGVTPLQAAMNMTAGNTSSFIHALVRCGADVNTKGGEGSTPLICVSKFGDVHAIRCLVERSANVNVQNSNGISPVFSAAEAGHTDAVCVLAELGADLNSVTCDGVSPIHIAAKLGHASTVTALAHLKADLSCRDREGNSVIGYAAKSFRYDVVEILAKRGADVNISDQKGQTPLDAVLSFQQYVPTSAVSSDEPTAPGSAEYPYLDTMVSISHETIMTILALVRNKAEANKLSSDARSPLFFAACCEIPGIDDVIYQLVRADLTLNSKSAAPILAAVKKKNITALKALLFVNSASAVKSDEGEFVLALREAMGTVSDDKDLRLLLALVESRADANAKDNDGATPLYLAAKYGDADAINCLIKHGALVDDEKMAPIYVAAERGHTQAIRSLAAHKADLNVQTSNDPFNVPITAAIKNGHGEAVFALAKLGARMDITNSEGRTLIQVALDQTDDSQTSDDYLQVIMALVQVKADVNARSKAGTEPLSFAAKCGDAEAVHTMIAHGANIAAQSDVVPLIAAAERGHTSCVYALAHYKADVNVQTTKGICPLYVAAKMRHLETVEALLGLGSAVNKSDSEWASPLHAVLAAENFDSSNLRILSVLIRSKADPNTVGSSGLTPLALAAKIGDLDVMHNLVRCKADVAHSTTPSMSPLFIAAENGQTRSVFALVHLKADLPAEADDDMTPLMIAAKNGHLRTMHALFQCGHGVSIVDQKWVIKTWGDNHKATDWVLQALAAFGAEVQLEGFCKTEGWVPSSNSPIPSPSHSPSPSRSPSTTYSGPP
jgi:ankyrin repeat protein